MLSRPIRLSKAYMGFAYAFMTVYRGELFLWMIATSLPIIMMGIWVEAGESGAFPGFGPVDAARYFIAVFIVRQFTVCWVIYDFEYQVVTGKLSSRLMHPADPAWYFVTNHLADQAIRAPFCIGLLALCFVIQPQALWGNASVGGEYGWWVPSLQQVGAAVVATYTAFALRFLMQYTLAMLAFWHERVAAADAVLMVPYTFLSGLVIPLQLLPEPLDQWVFYTPFPYMVWWPATLLAGGDAGFLQPLLVVTGWLVGLYAVNRVVWRRGLKHYSAMGA
ncbi:MAG: ABC-2 family transporter protein [Planctomycetota bacterium]